MPHFNWSVYLFFLLSGPMLGQYGEHTWFIGGGNASTQAGIRFGSDNQPTPYNGVRYPLQLQENNILVADGASGDVIFYSDGQQIIDGSHQIMPNGGRLAGTPSNMYGTAVVYDPAGCRQYYLFYGEDETATPPRNLYYTKIDADLPGNGTAAAPLGDVIDGERDIPLVGADVNLSEGIFALPKNDGTRDSWLFAGQRNGNRLLQFEVTAAGVSLFATYALADFFPGSLPVSEPIFGLRLAYRSDGGEEGRLVVAVGRKENNTEAPIGVLSFNRVTGAMEGDLTLIADDTEWTYGLAFSPDGTKLYYSDYFQKRLRQYDFSTGQLTTVGTSRHSGRTGGLRLAPDGRIYWANIFTHFSKSPITTLARINRPNEAGTACELVYDAVSFNSSQDPTLLGALPSFGSFPEPPATEVLASASCGRANGSARVAPVSSGGPFTYAWDNGETSTTAVSLDAGIHSVTITAAGGCTETVSVLIDSLSGYDPEGFILQGTDDTACSSVPQGSVALRHPAVVSGESYAVSFTAADGAVAERTIIVGQGGELLIDGLVSGEYSEFAVTGPGGCTGNVPGTVRIGTRGDLPLPEISGPTVGCPGDSLLLTVVGVGSDTVEWFGPNGYASVSARMVIPEFSAAAVGTYRAVRRTGTCISDTARFTVDIATVPQGVGYDTTVCAAPAMVLPRAPWMNLNWEGGTTDGPLEVTQSGRYGFELTTADNCTLTDTVAVNVVGLPRDFLPEEIAAEQCDSVFLQPELPAATAVQMRWSGDFPICADCATAALFVTGPGNVVLTLTENRYGCTTTDSTFIAAAADGLIYVPNAFSPNGDGVNDVFTVYARKPGTVIAAMDIYDRWGGRVFHVADLPVGDPAAGWHGSGGGLLTRRVMNSELFVYAITLRYVDGTTERLEGQVYLIR